MKEAFKAYRRRSGDPFWNEVYVGTGLDVGTDDNAIQNGWYPNVKSVTRWTGGYLYDLRKFKPASFDFVNLSEQLEHENSLFTAVLSWYYLLKTGGHMVITVPDFRLYESDQWPSVNNREHKWAFSISRKTSNHHLNLVEFLARIPGAQIRRIHLADSNYNYSMFRVDQTLGEAEAAIEVVIRKLPISDGSKRTFKHSGARGDLIYALPAMKMLGGGKLYINRSKDHFFGLPISDVELKGIAELLKTCPYVDGVEEWSGQQVDFDLDVFRELDPAFIILSASYLIRLGTNADLSKPWLSGERIPAVHKADIVVSRTTRYHSPFDWGELKPWIDRCCFVGTKDEHDAFVKQTGLQIRYEETSTWMDLASIIRGSKVFVGNQSFAYALAEAMKHPRVLEVCSHCPNCDPQSDNGHVHLSQGIIRRYLLNESFSEITRKSRSEGLQVAFSRKKVKEWYENVSCVIVGKSNRVAEFAKELKAYNVETVIAEGVSFEQAANNGFLKTTRHLIGILDADLCESMASVGGVIEGIIQMKAGMVSTSLSMIGTQHCSGSCFAVTRETYEKAGLFNLAVRPGEASMIELFLRYSDLGIVCRSLSLPGWQGRPSSKDDENRNREYMRRNFGVEL